MRVLHVHSGNLFGGIESTLVLQARHRDLVPSLDLHFALCFEGRLSRELLDANVPVYELGKVRVRFPITIWRARRRLIRLLKEKRFDVVITHGGWSHAIFGSVVRSIRLPLVMWMHGLITGKHWLDRWALRTEPDLVLCNSNFVRQALVAKLRKPQGHVFYNPRVIYCPFSRVDDEELSMSEERLEIRKEFNTPRDAVVIVQVSRMEPWKGHELHLRALSLLKDVPDWVCWQVGGPQRSQEARYFRKLKRTAAKLGIEDRVVFLGQRVDVSKLLRVADIHCQPNTGPEPFGNTFIEGLSHGLPVVTTAMGGGKEIVDESCGMLVTPDDPVALAESLKHLIQNPSRRRQLGSAGPARARELCDLETQMNHLYRLLLPLVHTGF